MHDHLKNILKSFHQTKVARNCPRGFTALEIDVLVFVLLDVAALP
jgi:hypothetical protein